MGISSFPFTSKQAEGFSACEPALKLLNHLFCIIWDGHEEGCAETQHEGHHNRSTDLWIKVSAELSSLDALVQQQHQETMPGCQKGLALQDLPERWLLLGGTRQFIQHQEVRWLFPHIALEHAQKR